MRRFWHRPCHTRDSRPPGRPLQCHAPARTAAPWGALPARGHHQVPAVNPAYVPRQPARSLSVPVRGLHYHVTAWGDLGAVRPEAPLRVLMHGWMDVGASFQFVVDALDDGHAVIAPDWRGFGLSEAPPRTDSYWFADYLGDLDALLDHFSPEAPVDLLGHSMGGNVVMVYAGVRPQRIRRLVNLEGFGLPDSDPADSPPRLAQWLDELKTPQRLKPYDSLEAVAQRLRQTNPRLAEDKAAWLANHWAEPDGAGHWRLRADAAHKRVNPVLYRAQEVMQAWRRITAPVLWVEGDQSRPPSAWTGRYKREEFEARLAKVPQLQRALLANAGHMLHHDQPEALAAQLRSFWTAAARG
ncbi:MAG: alpha/beta hydrolase [Burkholderiales bacterium]|nr:alpha/beta hydrolase [Burkholderiales bacterium]